MICARCKFFRSAAKSTIGECKRYPSVVRKSETDWCGDWAEIPVAARVTGEGAN